MRRQKTFDELTITDDFMFGAVMTDKRRCKRLIEEILGIRISRIEYPAKQKVLDFTYDGKSVRLDVYVEDENNTVYNIEMQTTDKSDLPLRIRYYHDMIDLNIIEKGENYKQLKRSYVIFICTFDPFRKDRYMYTFDRRCREEDFYLEDKATSIVLNCTGSKGEISEELKDLLSYMAGNDPHGEFARDIAKGVEEVRENRKWRADFMTLAMRYMEIQEEAREEGRAEGREEGRELGTLRNVILSVRKLRSKMDDDELMETFEIDRIMLNKIVGLLDAHPDWSDDEIARSILGWD